jgi:hypothetical protein
MNIIKQALDIIADAEKQLRKLLADSATGGDYRTVVQLAGWAHRLSDLQAEIAKAAPAVAPARPGRIVEDSAPQERVLPLPFPRKSKRAREYPKFFRKGETLVKVGWSKSQKEEYEHKAPSSVLSDLVAAILSAAARQNSFVMETIMPLKSSRDGAEIPGYQVYLCLAWLREKDLVLQHGRQGYSVKPKIDLGVKARELFTLLPEKVDDYKLEGTND